ncbi:hypothetical protein R69888_01273 [Paraburkholderia haematera]|uniref:Uncharacterized protein n=1 Tax=Paraburkholderia haematera TaxID=2793077 RepID=A0ABM8QSX3_9BURK|nr:hypothetical protein R69888_01273 [Paraburkholderia haematera]
MFGYVTKDAAVELAAYWLGGLIAACSGLVVMVALAGPILARAAH